MNPICQTDCCLSCPRKDACPGCAETNGHPFGGNCYAAEAIKRGKSLAAIKAALCDEINALAIPGVTVSELYLLSGAYVNLLYPLPSGEKAKLLRDENVYLGTQIERPDGRYVGVIADEDVLILSAYSLGGADSELLLYRKRK